MTVCWHEENYKGVRVCCSCGHNIRDGKGGCYCEVDGHYIGYIENFGQWCRKWKRDRKWDEVTDEQTKMH